MDKIIIVYLAYLWVGLLHSSFAGITLYTIWGQKMKQLPNFVPILILFTFLALLELYWIPIFSSLGLSVHTSSPELHTHFNITANTDIVKTLRPNIIMVAMWFFQTFLAYRIGNYFYKKNRIQRNLS